MSNDPLLIDDHEDGAPGIPAQLRDPIGVLRRQIFWILATLIVFLAITAVATSLFTLQYQARAVIQLTAKSIPDNYVPTTIMANILEQFEEIRGPVLSRDGLSKIIIETGLYAEEQKSVSLAALAARLNRELTVEPISNKTSSRGEPHALAFSVTMEGSDPEMLAKVVNATVSKLVDANVAYRSRQARVTTDFMQREFDQADQALRLHQRRLAEFRANNRGGALPEEQDATLSKLDRLEDQRRSAILQISDLRARLERIDARPQGQGGLEELTALRVQLQNARAVYTDEHPTVRSLERRLAELEEGSTSKQSPSTSAAKEERAEIEYAIELEHSRLAAIEAEVTGLEDRLGKAPKISEEYSALIREESILQENYVNYLRKLNSAELALSLEQSQQGAQLTRLETALPPSSPIMSRWIVAAGGVVVSIGLALLVGVARELLLSVVIDEKHLEDSLPIPCLGSIAEIS